MAQRTCSIDGCERPADGGRGWCEMHYQRWRKHGDPTVTLLIRGDVVARFLAKVNKHGPIPEARPDLGECWLWTAYLDPAGYGRFGFEGVVQIASRVSYQLFVGPIPEDHEPDHLCFVPACVRPTHLEAVTHEENQRRRRRSGPRPKEGITP